MENNLVLKVPVDEIEIIRHDDCVEVHIKNDVALVLNMDGDGMINSKGDFYIRTEGELGLMSFGKPLCLDSVGSEIHMNYRQSKPLINDPESIEYRKQLEIENKKCIQIATMQEMQNKTLKERVSVLEDQIDLTLKAMEKITTVLESHNIELGGNNNAGSSS